MKKKLYKFNDCWNYNLDEWEYTQEQYDYAFKYLNFNKFNKYQNIHFKNKELRNMFFDTYGESCYLKNIYNTSQKSYEWLKDNWGKNIFTISIFYSDKQELKTIVNKLINIELMKNYNENKSEKNI